CDAECSPERGFYYSASRQSAGQPIVAGWSYQWIAQLDWAHDSWTAPLDALRIPPATGTTSATIDQIRRLVNLLPGEGAIPLFVLDAGYDPIALSAGLANTRASVLVRIRSDRVFYGAPDPAATAGGSTCRSPTPLWSPMLVSPPAMTATAPSSFRLGAACTPSCAAGDAGQEPTAPRSWPGP